VPFLESARMRRKPLMLQKKKAIAIKTYMPKYEKTYSIDRRYDPDRERARKGKETTEYKRELKGAIRELRKDAAFVGREKLLIIKEKDAQYKKKMAKIVGQLAEQEGAMRGYEKENKKSKRRK
jgi:nucleolar protein 14